MKLKLMIAAVATALAAETASAQVFVIGNGLGGECFQKTKSNFSNFRSNRRNLHARAARAGHDPRQSRGHICQSRRSAHARRAL